MAAYEFELAVCATVNVTWHNASGPVEYSGRDPGDDADAVITYSDALAARMDADHVAEFTLIPVTVSCVDDVSNLNRNELVEYKLRLAYTVPVI